MSRFARLAVFSAAALFFPGLALLAGVRALDRRDHPALLPPADPATLAAAPRPMLDRARPTVVVLLGRDLTEITDALGPHEMFARAGKYNVVMAAIERQPTLLTGGLRILPHYSLGEVDSLLAGPPAVVVIPNLPNADQAVNRPAIDWIRRQAAAGSLIHSWCKGAMALAEAGLLDGRTATAHWGDIAKLEKRYPAVTWVRGVRWIDRGQYVMSAGITSGIDASLRVLIRIAGDSVARRVAREIRYPNFHFAIDPAVEQYTLRPSDAVLLANAAFRPARPRVGIALYDGVTEFDLSNIYDAHVHTMVVDAQTVSATHGPVVTAHGLTLYPSRVVSAMDGGGVPARESLDRLLVPGTRAREGATSLTEAVSARLPGVTVEYLHADEPDRFGLEPVMEHLARVADVRTARFALRRMELRSTNVRFDGPALPLVPLITLAALLGAGVGLALILGAQTNHGDKSMQVTTYTFRRAAALVMALFAIACAELPTEVPADPTDPTDPTKPSTPTVASVTLSRAQLILDEGGSQAVVATPRDSNGAAITGLGVTWTNSDPRVAEVDAAGTITGIRAGSTVITAKVHGRMAQATVVVQANYAFDLLYSVPADDIFREIYRVDVRAPHAPAARLFAANQWASQARPSPDGTRVVYVCPSPTFGVGAICVANRDGSSAATIIAFIGEEFTEPTWSSDGARIAYVRTRHDGVRNVSHIWVANADGSNPVPLTESVPGDQGMPAWSPRLPDGSERIAFVQDLNLSPRIWTMRVDGGDRRQLATAAGARDIQPAWSPDGRTIAFQRTSAGVSADIWMVNSDGSFERPLMIAPLAGSQLSPAWSPDGRLVAFASAHEASMTGSPVYQIYTAWADGTKLARRTFDASDKSAPVFLPVAR